MKKLFKNLGLILLVSFGILFIANSCVVTPECEKHRYNDVTIINNTGVPIVVDLTYVGSEYNEERYLSVNRSTTYYRMNSGSLWVWGNAGYGWSRNTINTRACQNFTYTWHPLKSGELVLEIGWEGEGNIFGEGIFEKDKGQ